MLELGELPRPHRRRAQVAHLPRADDVVEGLHRLLDRHVVVEPVEVVDVDVVRPEPAQRGVELLEDRLAGQPAAPPGPRASSRAPWSTARRPPGGCTAGPRGPRTPPTYRPGRRWRCPRTSPRARRPDGRRPRPRPRPASSRGAPHRGRRSSCTPGLPGSPSGLIRRVSCTPSARSRQRSRHQPRTAEGGRASPPRGARGDRVGSGVTSATHASKCKV